ncbi:MAG TPA: CoA ester lyase [Halothiobacillus sp.]|nr:CoA ester lyase [Halothiobacillus sp.]
MTPRSWLFIPGDSPAKIAKAAGSGADAVIFDLEDSVALPRKDEARSLVATTLNHAERANFPQLWVRINPLTSGFALGDLAAVVPAGPAGIVLPKPDSATDVIKLSHYLDAFEATANISHGSTKILPIATETPASLFGLASYGTAGPRLIGLTWGAEDLPAAIGASSGRTDDGTLTDLCRLARSLCLAAAANAGVPAIDTVYPDFRDLAGLRMSATAARREGFVGMMAIHPSQVLVINQVMTPSDDEIAFARRIVDLFAADPGAGVLALDGKMLDQPHLKQARRILSGK